MRLKTTVILSLILLGLSISLSAQNKNPSVESDSITKALIELGLQGVVITSIDSTVIIAFENRVFRLEANAVDNILKRLINHIDNSVNKVVLVSKKQDIPFLAWEINPKDYQFLLNKEISIHQFQTRLSVTNFSSYFNLISKNTQQQNPGNYKIEIVVEPTLGLALGGFPDAVLHQINLNPTLNIFLWKGAQVKLQGIFPISNELSIPEEKYTRPSLLAFNQQVRLPKNLFLNAGIGYFTKNRYGVNLDIKKLFFNGNLMVKGKTGYTGYASFLKELNEETTSRKLKYTNLNYWDYSLGVHYWLPKWNINIGLSYGKFSNEKKVVRLEVNQNFKETVIGFFAFKTETGSNYGMNIAIPFFPKKYWKPKSISIRPPTHFHYTYHSKWFYVQEYWSGNNEYEKKMNPSLSKYQFLRLLRQHN